MKWRATAVPGSAVSAFSVKIRPAVAPVDVIACAGKSAISDLGGEERMVVCRARAAVPRLVPSAEDCRRRRSTMGMLEDRRWDGRLWLGGEWVAPAGGTRDAVEPATGVILGQVGLATTNQVAAATAKAAASQPEWAVSPFCDRAQVLRKAGDLLQANAAEIEDWIVREAGSVRPKAAFEIAVATAECYEAAALPSQPQGELLATGEPRLSFARRRPAGVVAVIAPFNVPLVLAVRSVAPALALGNAVVLKPDPRTAICGGAVLAAVFEQAGLPPGVLHVLPGGADVGGALVADPAVSVVSFTGSTRAGRAVGELAARHLKRVHLELGGNSAIVVLDDADPVAAAGLAAWGSFFHQGQVCMATGRHLVHRAVFDDYVDALCAKADALAVGDPATSEVALGPIIDESQRDRIHAMVTSSADAGATVAAGGTYEGLFYRPTVLTGVTTDMPAYAEEVFGPVAPVLAFEDAAAAAHLAAGSRYGLSLAIVTNDPLRALEMSERIPSGAVHINDQTVNDEAQIPFGGVGDSGTGARFGGASANIEAFTDTQWVTMRRRPAVYGF
jgi:benzaldehyde dehydrogenase (NAD)